MSDEETAMRLPSELISTLFNPSDFVSRDSRARPVPMSQILRSPIPASEDPTVTSHVPSGLTSKLETRSRPVSITQTSFHVVVSQTLSTCTSAPLSRRFPQKLAKSRVPRL